MAEKTFEDEIFIKQCVDEYEFLGQSAVVNHGYIRRIIGAVIKGAELKELSVSIRSNLMNSSADLYKLINAYKARYLPNGSIVEICKQLHSELVKKYVSRFDSADHNFKLFTRDPFSTAVIRMNDILRTINTQMEFIRTSYRVAESNDDRWNKATVKSIIGVQTKVGEYENDWTEYDKIEEELIKNKIDISSPEYGKLIIKRLNSFKADVISAFNKYYGKNSVFKELNLTDMIRQ